MIIAYHHFVIMQMKLLDYSFVEGVIVKMDQFDFFFLVFMLSIVVRVYYLSFIILLHPCCFSLNYSFYFIMMVVGLFYGLRCFRRCSRVLLRDFLILMKNSLEIMAMACFVSLVCHSWIILMLHCLSSKEIMAPLWFINYFSISFHLPLCCSFLEY